MLSQEKQKKLAYVARRYYLENQRQSDIAKELGVSRPLVSRMLSEARELGVVEITILQLFNTKDIHPPLTNSNIFLMGFLIQPSGC